MAAEIRQSSIEQCILDIAECPICHEVLQDNRCLPCLHMFCLKCFESYRKGKPKGKPLPCPVCRREFPMPKYIADLPRNFFIDKLLDAHKIRKQDALPIICEICSDDTAWRSTVNHPPDYANVALASRFCCDCRQHMCLSCERQHRKIKSTAMHKIIDSKTVINPEELAPKLAYCFSHPMKEAEVYCQDCTMVICWQCKALSHSSHASLDVISATKDLAAKLEEHIEKISGYQHTNQAQVRKLTECQKLYTDKIEVESAKISREQRRLCRDITDNGDQLKKALFSSTSVHLNAFSVLLNNLETDAAELSKHKFYIEQMIHLGNVSDLSEYTNMLMLKAARLAEEHRPNCEINVPPIARLSDSDLQDLLTGKRRDIDSYYQYSAHHVDSADISNVDKDQFQNDPSRLDQTKGSSKDWFQTFSLATMTIRTNAGTVETSEKKRNSFPSKQFKGEDSSKCEDWSLMRIIAPEKDCTVCGITVLDSMLYVVLQDSSNISVYHATNLVFLEKIPVKSLILPNDIVSCKFNNCLYVCDWSAARIFRVEVREEIKQMDWSTDKDIGCLSVTSEHSVLLAGYVSGKLKEFSSDGVLIRSIELKNGLKPWHAIRFGGSNMQYLICEGDNFSAFHRVCLIGLNGEVINSFGGVKGSDEKHLCGPYHLAVDKSGCILVNDCNNSRLLFLSKDLKFIGEIIPSSANVLRRARRMHLDEVAGRLYVADNARGGGETMDGRILVFSNSSVDDSML